METLSVRGMEQDGIQRLLDAALYAANRESRRVEIIQKPNRRRDYRVGALVRAADGKPPLYDSRFLEPGLYIDIYC